MDDSWTNRSSESDKWIVYISTYAFGRRIGIQTLDLGIASAKTCLNDSFMNQSEQLGQLARTESTKLNWTQMHKITMNPLIIPL